MSDRLCWPWGPEAGHVPRPSVSPPLPVPGQVVMTIIVAFILEAFVFRMNYNRKNQDSEGLWSRRSRSVRGPLPGWLAVCPAVGFLAVWQCSHLVVRPSGSPVICLAYLP